jgi:hypothetical protein
MIFKSERARRVCGIRRESEETVEHRASSIENIIQHSTARWQNSDNIVWSKNKENTDERSCGAAREYNGSPTYDRPVTSFKITMANASRFLTRYLLWTFQTRTLPASVFLTACYTFHPCRSTHLNKIITCVDKASTLVSVDQLRVPR